MTPTSTPPRGLRATLATALCALATITSLHAVTNLFSPEPWRAPIVLQVLFVAAVVAGARALTASAWVPSVVGVVVAYFVVILRYGAPPGRAQLVPDLDAWRRLVALWGDGLHLIDTERVPVDVSRPLELVLAVGALLVFLAADALAVALGMTAWAGLPLAAMWLPTITLGYPARWSALFGTALCYLLLLALSVAPRGTRDENSYRARIAAGAAVGVVTAALVLGPVLASLPGWSSWGLPRFGSGAAGPVTLSTDLDLRDNLGSRSGQVVLTYVVTTLSAVGVPADATTGRIEVGLETPGPSDGATGAVVVEPTPSASPTAATARVTAGTLGPLRAFTLTSFDGREWNADEGASGEPHGFTPQELLSPDPTRFGGVPSAAYGSLAQVDVEIGVLQDDHLPIPIFARSVDVDGNWWFDALRDQVQGSAPTSHGMRVTYVAEIPELTADELRAASTGTPDDPAALEVPATSHADDIRARALEVTAGASSPYEQAMALQTYLRSTANFTYDTRLEPARTDDAVWDFLESRTGYCVQFATAMTMMARTLGIPARVGVGFLPGKNEDGTYVVTGRQSHAWPELNFEGYGWVRFEPTPAVQSGLPPEWSNPLAGAGNSGPTEPALPTANAGSGSTSAPQSPGGSTATTSGAAWLPIALTVLLVLGIGALAVWLLARRRTRAVAERTPEQAWVRLRRRLARSGVGWSDATTPRAVVGAVQEKVQRDGRAALAPAAVDALAGLARDVERERYAPTPPEPVPGALDRAVDVVAEGVESAMRRSRFRRR
ncbi:transglutaminase family protein [Cellulomonas composti]|uniref:Transglutaminase-like domain-containing protein n=1 Tax=Cellulomonas composti TaxID=266130 RepID=A0A511J8C9_9CELL|nr:transglutaminase domain-containing protein [Cellulomonas composti]GEL94252.1 hypothetical protein CCO02nite_09100 [Cellulomonas composti]